MTSKRGLGSIDRLESGRYRLRYTDPNGIRRSAATTFKTKTLAEMELTRIRQAIDNGTWNIDQLAPISGLGNPKTITLAQLAEHWRGQQVSSKGLPLSPTTLREYQRLIESTLARFAHKPIREITRTQIEHWRAPELKRAPNQTVKAYKHLKTLMTWAERRKWIPVNPCDIERATAYTSSEPPAPDNQQVLIMIENAKPPFNVLVALAAYGGFRKGELLELRRKDFEIVKIGSERWVQVHVSRAVIWVNGEPLVKSPKTEAGFRSVLLPMKATELVTKHLASIPLDPDALLFSDLDRKHWSEHKLNTEWRKIRVLAGFSGRFHSLRTFSATEFAKRNPTDRELMERFGHRDIKTAMRYQRTTGREAELLRELL